MDETDVKSPGEINPISEPTGNPPAPDSPTVPAPPAPKSSGKKLFGKLSVLPTVVIAAAVLAGGTAAGYYGIILPNKPENVLKTAITNTLEQKKAKFDGKFVYESTDPEAEVKAVNLTFSGQSDIEKNAYQSNFEVAASGAKLPLEIRRLDKNFYFKIGDLSSIKSVVELAAPGYGSIVDTVGEKIANQWFEFDETLLKQAGADCALNISLAPTQEDIELIQKRYSEVPFTTIKSTSDDTVNGRSAIKYDMELDDNKGAEFVKSLDELSFVKKIKECQGESTPLDTSELADDDITPITLWVDKGSKTIAKFAMYSTKQDEEKAKAKGSFEISTVYGEAEISKPEGARPAVELLNDLQSLFLGQVGLDQSTLQGLREQDLSSFNFD